MADLSRREWLTGIAAAWVGERMRAAQGNGSPAPVVGDGALERRKQYLAFLRKVEPASPPSRGRSGRINPIDKSWDEWVDRTGELPPDFEKMPSQAGLADPLVIVQNGQTKRITKTAQWKQHRKWLQEQFQYWIYGKMPPAPGNVRGTVAAARQEADAMVHDVTLEFGPDHKATLKIQVMLPPGKGPFPVFVTNHPRMRPWVNTAVRRGYLACIYNGLDPGYGTPDDSDKWLELYPEYDWSALARWAWAASRAIDYLETLPQADKTRICLAGHSRNSKSSLLAAAFDERIGAVVPSRGNTGDALPWRFTSPHYVQEPIEEITIFPHVFHPRLRFFIGREHKLPVDQHQLMALVAPRGLMISHAYLEHQGNPVGIEQAYRATRQVYRLLGKEDHLWLYQQPGEHPSSVEDVEQYFDFFDTVFGRKRFPKKEQWVHGYTFGDWQSRAKEKIDPLGYPKREVGDFLPGDRVTDWKERQATIRQRIRWLLGEEPPGIPYEPRRRSLTQSGMTSEGWRGQLFLKPVQQMRAVGFPFGDDLRGELYVPSQAIAERDGNWRARLEGRFPVVVWLHPYSYNMGYARYGYWGPLVNRGFLVVTFDQIGFGARNEQALRFYERYPRWSLLGKMVTDTLAAVESLSKLQSVDPGKIYLFGWALGAKIALLAAALDDRVAGVATFSGYAPMRTDTADKGTEGLRHYSRIHGLLPRLGFFEGHENRVPVDWDEILAASAPRPVHMQAPVYDRFHAVEEVRRSVEAARKVYRLLGSESGLVLDTPEDFTQFRRANQMLASNWLGDLAGLPRTRPREPKPAETGGQRPPA
jgi:dienelactone hydrolase